METSGMADQNLKLGVNIDHVATLRQARGTVYPSVVEAAKICESAGAEGITIHLREDRRHIQDADVRALRESIGVPLNLEMANAAEIVGIALDVLPDEVCMVPEKREELTTEGGLDVAGQYDAVAPTVGRLREAGIVVSLFIEPDERQIRAAADSGAEYIELHTGTYCDATDAAIVAVEHDRLIAGSRFAVELGLKVNAGHGINLQNISGILDIPNLDVLNIGHSIVAHAVFVGLENAVKEMYSAMCAYTGGCS
jgi:pyridoxine 5-phosphate synthase